VVHHPLRDANPWKARLGGLAVVVATLALMVATEPYLAIVWDEGQGLGREDRVRLWFRALRDPGGFAATFEPPRVAHWQEKIPPPRRDQVDTRAKLFEPRTLAWFWPFAREEPLGHPPFFALVGLAGDALVPSWSTLPRARFGPMLVFSLTAGALYLFAARRWGLTPAALSAGAWVLQPNLFALGHYATYDALLAGLWVGSILAFVGATRLGEAASDAPPRWGRVLLFGLLAGCAAATKLTGWFLPWPFVAWTLLRRDRRGAWTLAIGGAVALATLYALIPPWWADPVGGFEQFLRSNLTRAQTIPIKTLFLGRVYQTPIESLPWYNTLVWTVFATPVGFLGLALAGARRGLVRAQAEPVAALALGHWAALLVLRSLPHTPGHDGIRQFLPAFGCLALVAGPGAAWAVGRFGRWGQALLAASLAEGALSVALMMPVPLSYFSPLVGGLPGASALGMEPTFFWDALTDEPIDWLNGHTGPLEKVKFATETSAWTLLRDEGRLRPGIWRNDPGHWAWYVVQNRPGSFSWIDRDLVAHARPAHVVLKQGVPLIWIFPFAEVEARLNPRNPRP